MRIADINPKLTFQKRGGINHGAVSQAARRLNTIGVLNLTPNVYSRFLSVLASRCKVFADRLAELGLPKDVTPEVLVQKYGSVFTPKGLAKKCVLRVSKACKNAGLSPEQTTVFGFLRHEGVKKPSILSVLHGAGGAPTVRKVKARGVEPPSEEQLAYQAKVAENWRKEEARVRKFYEELGEKVDW